MPQRPFTREQVFLLPPRLDEWIGPDHPVRLVAAWLEDLPMDTWSAMGIDLTPSARGEARYAPQALLVIWVYGFMVGVRSTRALETACRDQLPFRWLSGNQTPDHNTLSRFYRLHRDGFHHLFHASITYAVRHDLLDWGLQAVDGTKLWADASGDRMLDAAQLARVAARVEAEIARLEAGVEVSEVAAPEAPASPGTFRHRTIRLPQRRQDLQALRDRIQRAQARLAEGRTKGNLTDPDAHQMMAQGVNRPSYNAQAVVRPLQDGGRLIVAIDVRTRADDHELLPDLALQATVRCEQPAAVTVADAGYHSGAVLTACADTSLPVVMPSPMRHRDAGPYGAEAFRHDPATDTLTCPEGIALRRWRSHKASEVRYGAPVIACQTCPAKAACCPTSTRGRVIVRSVHHAVLARHRAQMTRPDCTTLHRRRKGMIEGVFGTLKTRHGGRRCLLRGLANVQAEWTLLATAFNLQTLVRHGLGKSLGTGVGPTVRIGLAGTSGASPLVC
ncbi:MAG: IS1182 family transposase, partial [Beutenbergiaceae bacterium]